MEPLIRMEGIKKVFYTDEVETHALADVHLEIRPGEYIAIAGPSGCGKTTLLSILGLLDTPTDGTYMLSGEHVAKLSAADRARIRNRQIGFIFQAFNLIGDLTVNSRNAGYGDSGEAGPQPRHFPLEVLDGIFHARLGEPDSCASPAKQKGSGPFSEKGS